MEVSEAKKTGQTRQHILENAFGIIHRKGFRATGLSDIIASTGLTKGAFYHHFSSKNDLGYAILDELLPSFNAEYWGNPLMDADDPVSALQQILRTFMVTPEAVVCGCPLNNLAVEMAPVDEEFRKRIDRSYQQWIEQITGALERGRERGTVAQDVDCHDAAEFFIASFAGCRGYAKVRQSTDALIRCNENLCRYLESLRGRGVTTQAQRHGKGHGKSAADLHR